MMINLIKPEPKFRNGYKDKKRLSDIHKIPCVNCFAKGRPQRNRTIAHHKIGMGIGLKASDLFTMAICESCHTGTKGIHNIPLKKWEEDNFSQDDLIELTNKLLENIQ
jgi:hypothetical protein